MNSSPKVRRLEIKQLQKLEAENHFYYFYYHYYPSSIITIIIITRKQELYAGGGDPVSAAAAGAQGQRDPQAGEGATQTQGRSQLKILKDNKKIFKDFVLRLHI